MDAGDGRPAQEETTRCATRPSHVVRPSPALSHLGPPLSGNARIAVSFRSSTEERTLPPIAARDQPSVFEPGAAVAYVPAYNSEVPGISVINTMGSVTVYLIDGTLGADSISISFSVVGHD